MNTKYLSILEYDKIIEILNKYCKTYLGKQQLLKLTPSFDATTVINLLNETNEAVNLTIKKSGIPLGDIPNINIWLKKIESNSTLSTKALLEVATIFKVSRELREYFYSDEDFVADSYPILSEYFYNIYTNKGIEEKIFNTILDENTIDDKASPKLSVIRKKTKKLEQNIRDKLDSFIHSSTYSKYIMEPIVTIRNDRFVVPIKEEYKNNVKGFIHDVSSSGSSVFIEPISVFEMNNQIANLRIEENIEIERILQDLSNALYPYSSFLSSNLEIIGKLDLLFAKSSYSLDIDGILPIINNKKYVNFIKARHPLIPKNVVVPIDISIGDKYNSLVITGPNTGGKTVSLKTIGLILLMAYSGIFIPCNEDSSIYIFDYVFADIGDEQSIEQSLSTFSSHISNIIDITNTASQNSLILLDELGAGTDPIEGANLAISILQYFYNLGASTISTTHYQEIKNFCLLTNGFENASCEFDVENLKPTYKLLIGIPGKSNAFAISKKLGLKPEIIETASNLMKSEDISIEELMKNIYDDKIAIENEKIEIEKNAHQIESLKKSLETENVNIKTREKELIEKAKIEARDIILDAKNEVNDIIREISNIEKDYKNYINQDGLRKSNQLRNRLNDKLKDIDNSNNSKLNLEILKSLNTKDRMKDNKLNNNSKNNRSSNVVFIKNDEYKSKNISSEINVIGLNVDEARFLIDKYIDDCAIAKLSPIRIVHGKGTGKLRQGIHTYLNTNPHVKTFRIGTFGEGEMGVTIVELK